MGIASSFGDADVGTQARFKRANETNEVKGVKFKYRSSPTTSRIRQRRLSEARRLVTQERVFAIVPDLSAVNPGAFFNQQHVPYIGWAFDNTYCSQKPSPTSMASGSTAVSCRRIRRDALTARRFYKYVTDKNPAKKKPSIVLFSNDNQSGQNSTKFAATGAAGAGSTLSMPRAPCRSPRRTTRPT